MIFFHLLYFVFLLVYRFIFFFLILSITLLFIHISRYLSTFTFNITQVFILIPCLFPFCLSLPASLPRLVGWLFGFMQRDHGWLSWSREKPACRIRLCLAPLKAGCSLRLEGHGRQGVGVHRSAPLRSKAETRIWKQTWTQRDTRASRDAGRYRDIKGHRCRDIGGHGETDTEEHRSIGDGRDTLHKDTGGYKDTERRRLLG